MSFQDIMEEMLPTLEDGRYIPYVNGGGNLDVLYNLREKRRSEGLHEDIGSGLKGTRWSMWWIVSLNYSTSLQERSSIPARFVVYRDGVRI